MTDTDESLLTAFAGSRDERAFRALADRYLGLVFHTAMRRTNQRQIAEEVSQNILCALAQKASSLARNPDRLPAWLHRATLYESSKAMRAETSHQRRNRLHLPEASLPDESPWIDAIPYLDAALDQLPAADRRVVLLHFFQNRSFPGIARSLGKSTVAIQKQSQRALDKLARLLRAKGVTLTATTVATGLSAEFAKAAPLTLVQSATAAVLTGSASYSTTGLTLMFAAKSKVLIPLVLLLCAVPLVFQQMKHSTATNDPPPPPVRKGDESDAMAIIREQLALAVSDQPERASLKKALAACGRLKSNTSCYELLSDPKCGWHRLAPTTLCKFSFTQTFTQKFAHEVHAALFERWGGLDLDGALKILEKTGACEGGWEWEDDVDITFNLYKGAASAGDGQHVLDTLLPPGSKGISETALFALAYLMEGWARSAPDAAWQALVSFRIHADVEDGPIIGYFHGLPPNMDWAALSRKVNDYCAAGQFIANSDASAVRSVFRCNLAASWIRHDPAAALAWFGSNCDDRPWGGDQDGNRRVTAHAKVVDDWLKADLQGATQWLATWQSDTISVSEVLAKINEWQQNDYSPNARPDIGEAVGKLLQEKSNR